MFLFPFILVCLPLFPLSKSKQFLVELKNGKNRLVETNNGNGTAAQEEFFKVAKDKSKLNTNHKKVENGNGERTTESHLTTTDKIAEGEDYVLFEFLCFLIRWCPFGDPYENNPTEPTQPTYVPGNYDTAYDKVPERPNI